jgi:type III restriction enzyme
VIVEHLTYDTLAERHDTAIFTENQTKQDFTKAGEQAEQAHLRLRRHRL